MGLIIQFYRQRYLKQDAACECHLQIWHCQVCEKQNELVKQVSFQLTRHFDACSNQEQN
uniref:Uncharacterized protein n=1 Tax=Arundo donax TaxID=35708 RepID=A0A0A9EWR6_ARUDO